MDAGPCGAGDAKRPADDGKTSEKKQHKEEYLPLAPEVYELIKNQYGLRDGSDVGLESFFTRSETAKSVAIVGGAVRTEFLDRDVKDLKIVHCGMKVFEKNERSGEVNYKLQQEGLHFVLDAMTKNKVVIPQRDFQTVIDNRGTLLQYTRFSAAAHCSS